MKLFRCPSCSQTVFYENAECESCGAALAYDPGLQQMVQLDGRQPVCANRQAGVCNWLVHHDESNTGLCQCCRLNRYVPDASQPDNRSAWAALEVAKRRLVYSLQRLQLPVVSKLNDEMSGLRFDFIDPSQPLPIDAVGTTGHAGGLVTINLDEADPVERVKAQESMEERYRTLLGHMRHEIGHYYWELLVQPDGDVLAAFRQLFGDESMDYQQALQNHYQQGAPADWDQNFVSNYASSHPWEDWAESWAHYLHLCDTLETAFNYGLTIQPRDADAELHGSVAFDPYENPDFDAIVEGCLPVIYATNSLNRSMGQPDLYPFVLVPKVIEKLSFIHRLLWRQRYQSPDSPESQDSSSVAAELLP